MIARSTLLDLFQEYFTDPAIAVRREHLLQIMGVIGFNSGTTHDTLDVLVDSGWLMYLPPSESYAASSGLIRTIDEGRAKVENRPRRPWNGEWNQILVHDCTSRSDADRQFIHGVLRWLGYGQIADCSWLHFLGRESEFAEYTRDQIDPIDFVTLRATSQNLGHDRRLAESAWKLHGLDTDYSRFIDTYEPRSRAFTARTPLSEVALIERLSVLNAFRHFVVRDPSLPYDLLPHRWHGHRAYDLYIELLSLLNDEARRFVNSVIGPDPVPGGDRG